MDSQAYLHQQKYEQFLAMMQELDLLEVYGQFLQDNGFDEWSSVSELNPDLIKEIGIQNDIDVKSIFACVKAADSIFEELDGLENQLQSRIVEESIEEAQSPQNELFKQPINNFDS